MTDASGEYQEGLRLRESGDPAAAEAAFRRGDLAGDAECANEYGRIAAQRGDMVEAERFSASSRSQLPRRLVEPGSRAPRRAWRRLGSDRGVGAIAEAGLRARVVQSRLSAARAW